MIAETAAGGISTSRAMREMSSAAAPPEEAGVEEPAEEAENPGTLMGDPFESEARELGPARTQTVSTRGC